MGLMDNETFLPGVITEVESDYSYGYDSSLFGTTDSVVVIGTAFNGPSGQPVAIYSPEHARYLFGRTFDSATKREATLVAGIEDAYQRGCRTIYAVRVGGKEIQKDFQFNTDSKLRLRVRGAYPTNQAKDFFLVYDNTEGIESVKIYKPAERATIVEKMQGAVESENSIIVLDLKINQDYGFTKDSLLADVIETVNTHPYNNVLHLSIVDEDGLDVTNSNMDARTLSLGVLFPGAYIIGRDKSLIVTDTEIQYTMISEGSKKPYEGFEGLIYKELLYNTDLSNGLPIFAKNNRELAENLKLVNVFSTKSFDFLETQGLIDRIFDKDKNDYEEAALSKFEIYKKLGSGFAVTAKAEQRIETNAVTGIKTEKTPRIKETPVSDVNRVAELRDGIYSMLENLNAKYRVLVCGNADDKITGKLPRAEEFKISQAVSADILEGLITVTPIVNSADHSDAKEYKFEIHSIEAQEGELKDSSAKIYSDAIIPSYAIFKTEEFLRNEDGVYVDEAGTILTNPADYVKVKITPKLANGTVVAVEAGTDEYQLQYFHENEGQAKLNVGVEIAGQTVVMIEEKLFKLDGNHFVPVLFSEFDAGIVGKEYVLVQSSGTVFAMKLNIDAATSEFKVGESHVLPLGDIETMFSDNEDQTIVFSQSNNFEVNNIVIQSAMLNSITLEEFVELLNEHSALNRLFKFEVAADGLIYKDDYVAEIHVNGQAQSIADALSTGSTKPLVRDRISSYDYNKYVPYKTSDNFARQLAQHCTYTSLKTAPSHGLIGMNLSNNMTLNGIATHVDHLMDREFDLYAKTAQGRNMLDRNNMPYPLGRHLSVPALQYNVVLDSGYVYRSNGSAGYAGMVSVLPLDQSSTNQSINVGEIAFELTNHQLTRLTQKGYVTIKNTYTKGFVITDGITMAPAESPFRRLNVSRIANAIEELIREAAEPFIGKQNHPANRNSLQTAIRSNLEKIKGTLIEAYEFNMVVDPTVMKFAYIDIDYNIVPIYEIREVRNRIKVKDQL